MKTKIPRSVNIFGHTYSVRIVGTDKLASGHAGIAKFPQREILIAKGMGAELTWMTFLHEICHARQFETGLTQVFGSQLAETDCEQFASLITSLQKQGVL